MATGRKHWHVTYIDLAWKRHTYRSFDKAKADAKLVEFRAIAPDLSPRERYDRCNNHPKYGTPGYPSTEPCTCTYTITGYVPICYQTPCSDLRHEKDCED